MNEIVLDFAPLIPLPILVGLVCLSLLIVGIAKWRGLSGWWLRALASLAILAALSGPFIRDELREAQKDIVFLVIDESESQTVSDRADQTANTLANVQKRFGDLANIDLRVERVVTPISNENKGTELLSTLARLAGQTATNRIAGAILVTDGQVHDLEQLSDFPAPVHVLLTGKKDDWDRRLVVKKAPAFAIVGEELSLSLRIEDQGAVPKQNKGKAKITISVDGGLAQSFDVKTNEDLTLPLVLDHGGMNVLQFNVQASDGELTERNNSAVVSINAVRDRLRVLLVSGEPHAGERTWRNLLKSDPSVDLVHFTILRSPEKSDGVPVRELSLIAFPTRELFVEKISEFDLIIFDRYKRRGILPNSYLQNIRSYVEQGGAIMVAAGEAFGTAQSLYRTPLQDILPASPTALVIEEGFIPQISDVGERHPVTQDLTDFAPRVSDENGVPGWGRWFRLIDSEKVAGNAVMTGPDDRPLLVLNRVGEGRVAMLMSDHAWLWSRGYEGGGPQLELLRRVAHWSMQEPDLEEERITARIEGQEVIVERRSLSPESQAITITHPDGRIEEINPQETSPGKWEYRFKGSENGLYKFADESETAVIAMGPSAPKEFENTIASGEPLRALRQATKGGLIELEGTPDPKIRSVGTGRVASGRGWIGITPRDAYSVQSANQSPLLPAWIWLFLAFCLSVAAWWREGR